MMKVSLSGLLRNASTLIDPVKDARAVGLMLDEAVKHIEGVKNGEFTLTEFATHYCITPPEQSK